MRKGEWAIASVFIALGLLFLFAASGIWMGRPPSEGMMNDSTGGMMGGVSSQTMIIFMRFFMILATVVLVLMAIALVLYIRRVMIERRQAIYCQQCGHKLHASWHVCPYCRKEIQ